MKEEFDLAISTAIKTKNVNLFGKISEELRIKYNVSKKTVHNRFHSIYGISFREYVDARIIPSKEELSSIILNTSSSEECRLATGLSHRKFVGIYSKVFGLSTYSAVKEHLLLTAPPSIRKSSLREDNLAILMSQYLGDGSYDKVRHSLTITHGEKQVEYLRWKVGMIIEGYNLQTAEIKKEIHSQGHVFYRWYSRKLGNVDFPENKSDAVPLLTPLGWLLWYLDDGTYGQDISICIGAEEVANKAEQELKTYGIESRVNKVSNANAYTLTMRGGVNSIKFYKVFIEPFLSIIPNCMLYKTEVKI